MFQRAPKQKQLQELYLWVDQIPLSRPKRNMARDFSDADKVLKKLKITLTKQDVNALANCEPYYAQKLIIMIKKYIQEQPEPSQASRMTKSKMKQIMLPVPSQQKKPKVLTFKDMYSLFMTNSKKHKDVKEILTNKDQEIEALKQTLQLFALKFSKLDEIVKSKDRQIEELVKKVKAKGIL